MADRGPTVAMATLTSTVATVATPFRGARVKATVRRSVGARSTVANMAGVEAVQNGTSSTALGDQNALSDK